VNEASKYSNPWNPVNKIPNNTVNINPKIVFFLSPVMIALCDHVTVAPLVNSIAVFNNGTSNGFKACIPTGGHTDPNTISGPNELWKYPQKNVTKNNTSDKMNKIIPIFNPL